MIKRTRFSPSPTGYLHIGGLRTALFAYLSAKSQNGRVILRLEDTDQKRLVADAAEKMISILDWCGLKFDEGPVQGGEYGPYVQSQRREIYDRYSKELLAKGGAYRCFCSPERLDKLRSGQMTRREPPRYDRACRDLPEAEAAQRAANGERFVIRQKLPLTGEIRVRDELRGEIIFSAAELDDHVLIKSNGMPTYHFAVVVDDHLMGISEVARGEEWLPSFPRHILLFQSFGWTPPKFLHLPLILNKSGGKLSKRQGDVSVEDFKNNGYLPEALLNFCALLGWHPRTDNEILDLAELIKVFQVKDIGVSPAVFEDSKLDYLNGSFIRRKAAAELVGLCLPFWQKFWDKHPEKAPAKAPDKIYLEKIILLEKDRLKKLSEIGERTDFFFQTELSYDPKMLIWKNFLPASIKANLQKIFHWLSAVNEDDWNEKKLEEVVSERLKTDKLGTGECLWPLRVSLTAQQASPGPYQIAAILGKNLSLKRVADAIKKL